MSELAREIIEEVCHMAGGPLPTDSEGINEMMGDCETAVDALLARHAPDPRVAALVEVLERIAWHEVTWKEARDIARVALAALKEEAGEQ